MPEANPLTRDIISFLKSAMDAYQSMSIRSINRTLLHSMYGSSYPKRFVGRAITRLKHRGYIHEEHNRIRLTPKGIARAQTYRLESLTIDPNQTWDGLWRVVIWDVPESQRKRRNQIRLVLKHLGFIRIQQSIWVTPFECHEIVDYLREYFELQSHLVFLTAVSIEDEEKLRAHFRLGPALVAPGAEEYHGDS